MDQHIISEVEIALLEDKRSLGRADCNVPIFSPILFNDISLFTKSRRLVGGRIRVSYFLGGFLLSFRGCMQGFSSLSSRSFWVF